MKKLLLLSLLFYTMLTNAQLKERAPFFMGSISTTFGINQDYEFNNDDDSESLIVANSVLLRTEFGYQFNQRWATSINFGYDHHFMYSINAIPAYGSVRYHFSNDDSESFYLETSYGKMWRPSDNFNDGDYYKIGLGFLSVSESRWNGVLKLDFHRKKINNFKNGNLDSISLGIGFIFF